ncbi:MAG: hypothetical protein KDN05_04075 [Verrucomicrobiae bacterium]|nr:hypothetical protein [Verrucomicrobiae bacterium]MCP5534057.1 hypothetical protein [Akkermansiaceae bacterium]MCP5544416.1 hypothetical protein [Akkermansiaceae bacterium]
MKTPPMLLLVPVALGIGYGIGRHREEPVREERAAASRPAREARMDRRQREDPFGGPRFSLHSMDEVRELFRRQRGAVAQARLTLAVEDLPAERMEEMMEMLRQDEKERPNDYEGRYPLMTCLFERWIQVDPTAAVEYVKNCKSRSFQQMAAPQCFSALAQEEPMRAMREIEELPKGELRSQVTSAVLAKLADHEPAMACDFATKESTGGGFSEYFLGTVFAKWAKTDPAAAAARFDTMRPDRVGEHTAGQVAGTWAQSDPESALAWAMTLKGENKTEAAAAVYRALALDDPAAAWERVKSEPGYMPSKLISSVMNVVADEDPDKAAAMLESIGSKAEQRIAVGEFVNNLRWYNSGLAFEIIDQISDPSVRRENLGNALYYAAWTSPEVLKEQVAKMTERERIDTADAVMRGLLNVDPAAAENYYRELPEVQRDTQKLENLMWAYSNSDPDRALKFAISLENPQEQGAAFKGLFENWSREDPEAAAAGWEKLPAGQSRLNALGQIAGSWASNDPESAMKWAEGLGGDERVRALAAVLPAMARDDPGSASRELSTLLAAPPEGMVKQLADSAGNIARSWAGDDPAGAADWAVTLPPGLARDAGLKSVAQAWSSYDAIATAQWLGTLEAGSSRDAAIEPLVQQVRQTDPATAFSWAASISDSVERYDQLRQTLQSWRSSDPQAARAALDAADISDGQRRKLAKELK